MYGLQALIWGSVSHPCLCRHPSPPALPLWATSRHWSRSPCGASSSARPGAGGEGQRARERNGGGSARTRCPPLCAQETVSPSRANQHFSLRQPRSVWSRPTALLGSRPQGWLEKTGSEEALCSRWLRRFGGCLSVKSPAGTQSKWGVRFQANVLFNLTIFILFWLSVFTLTHYWAITLC